MGIFDDILSKADESDRTVLAKYRQPVDELETAFTQADTNLKGYEAWYAANWDKDRKMTHQEAQLREQVSTQQSQIAALEARGESDMTFDEILAQAKPHIQTAVDSAVNPLRSVLLDEKGQPKVASNEDLLTSLVGMQNFYASTMTLPAQHFREFGKDLDGKAFVEFVAKNKMGGDPQRAYDLFVAKEREEARAAADQRRDQETQAKIEAARREGEDKARRELAAQTGRAIPSGGGQEASAMGPLQQRVIQMRNPEEAAKSAKTDPKIGLNDSRLAALAAEELVRKQMGGAA